MLLHFCQDKSWSKLWYHFPPFKGHMLLFSQTFAASVYFQNLFISITLFWPKQGYTSDLEGRYKQQSIAGQESKLWHLTLNLSHVWDTFSFYQNINLLRVGYFCLLSIVNSNPWETCPNTSVSPFRKVPSGRLGFFCSICNFIEKHMHFTKEN